MIDLLKRIIFFTIIFMGLSALILFIIIKTLENPNYLADYGVQNVESFSPIDLNTNINSTVNINKVADVPHALAPVINTKKPQDKLTLVVPYVNEAPDGNFTGPWKNACEEASITMVQKYYLHESKVSMSEAKAFMQMLFNIQNKTWGSNANSDAVRTTKLIYDNTIYNGKIINNPTIGEIKVELQQGRPVISLHYGFDLNNKNIPFVPAPRGSSYHMIVVIGYDDATNEFITNDTGDKVSGVNHRYDYYLFMNSLHDYNYAAGQADGTPRVIFTYPKLVKLADSPRVYYLHDNIKQYIPDETTFTAKGWTWNMVNIVEKSWLDNFEAGTDLKI